MLLIHRSSQLNPLPTKGLFRKEYYCGTIGSIASKNLIYYSYDDWYYNNGVTQHLGHYYDGHLLILGYEHEQES